MSNGKIEEDCIARVVNKGDLGKIVTVGKFLGCPAPIDTGTCFIFIRSKDIWEVDREVNLVSTNGEQITLSVCSESDLQRIDDGNLTEEELEAEEELVLISSTGEECNEH